MRFSCFTLFLIGLVALTACGGEPDAVLMDRRYLTSDQLDQQAVALRNNAEGVVLDYYEWTAGEHRLLTLLSRDRDAEGFQGIFLRHYQLGDRGAELKWTYQDSLACLGAAAGAEMVTNSSPGLRPGSFTASGEQAFVLRYNLTCAPHHDNADTRTLVVIDAATGTLRLHLDGETDRLAGLPTEWVNRLRVIWEG